jgi:hypothetical protein
MAPSAGANPDVALPPGEYVAEELETRGLTQAVAGVIGRLAGAMNEIIKGKECDHGGNRAAVGERAARDPGSLRAQPRSRYQLTRAVLTRRAVRA